MPSGWNSNFFKWEIKKIIFILYFICFIYNCYIIPNLAKICCLNFSVLYDIFPFFTRLSADSPFHAEHSWEQDKNIKKGKIQFGRCYPGLSEGALTFMKSSLNNKSWWVTLFKMSTQTFACLFQKNCEHKCVYSDMNIGGDPLQPSVSRTPGCAPIEPRTKGGTPKCVSPQTSSKITSSRRRRNETRSAPNFRVPSSSKATLWVSLSPTL